MRGLFYLLMIFGVTKVAAQERERGEGKGILFQTTLSWEQVQAKAKAENKFIFVDCFASWCGPCKEMDRDTYTRDSVGNYFNSRFVSVKVQMDTSQKDDQQIKSWYPAAHNLQAAYKVQAFPTFLFFSPNGKLVHRGLGFNDPAGFVALAKIATDPTRQYYTLLEQYKLGDRDYKMMGYLATTADISGESGVADTIARDYLTNYLYKMTDDELLAKPNLEFLSTFYRILTSADRSFQLLLKRGPAIDKIMWKGWGESVIDNVITREEIDPYLAKGDFGRDREPDWNKLQLTIAQKYGWTRAKGNVIIARINWYEKRKRWPLYTKTIAYRMTLIDEKKLDSSGLGISYDLNVSAWLIFLYSNNDRELREAIVWVKKAIQLHPDYPQYYDTYANLLYKLKLSARAIELEEKAVAMGKDQPDIKQNFEKMKAGNRTWLYPAK